MCNNFEMKLIFQCKAKKLNQNTHVKVTSDFFELAQSASFPDFAWGHF